MTVEWIIISGTVALFGIGIGMALINHWVLQP